MIHIILIALFILSGCSTDDSFVVGKKTSTPTGWTDYCQRHIKDCR